MAVSWNGKLRKTCITCNMRDIITYYVLHCMSIYVLYIYICFFILRCCLQLAQIKKPSSQYPTDYHTLPACATHKSIPATFPLLSVSVAPNRLQAPIGTDVTIFVLRWLDPEMVAAEPSFMSSDGLRDIVLITASTAG